MTRAVAAPNCRSARSQNARRIGQSVRMGEVSVRVSLVISEPWELASEGADSHRLARLAATDDGDGDGHRALVELVEPVVWRGRTFRYLVVKRRDGTSIASDLTAGASIECSFIGQPDDRAHGADPLDMTWWRGGLAGRVSVRSDTRRR